MFLDTPVRFWPRPLKGTMGKIIIEYDKTKVNQPCKLDINGAKTNGIISNIKANNKYHQDGDIIWEKIDITFDFLYQEMTVKGLEPK